MKNSFWVSDLFDSSIDWLIDWLIVRLIDSFFDWLIVISMHYSFASNLSFDMVHHNSPRKSSRVHCDSAIRWRDRSYRTGPCHHQCGINHCAFNCWRERREPCWFLYVCKTLKIFLIFCSFMGVFFLRNQDLKTQWMWVYWAYSVFSQFLTMWRELALSGQLRRAELRLCGLLEFFRWRGRDSLCS